MMIRIKMRMMINIMRIIVMKMMTTVMNSEGNKVDDSYNG